MRILSTLNEIDPPVIPPLKKIEQDRGEEAEWQVCRENPKYEINRKGQWRTRDYQPEFPMVGTPWPFPKSKPIAPLSLFEQEWALSQAQREPKPPTLAEFHQAQIDAYIDASIYLDEKIIPVPERNIEGMAKNNLLTAGMITKEALRILSNRIEDYGTT